MVILFFYLFSLILLSHVIVYTSVFLLIIMMVFGCVSSNFILWFACLVSLDVRSGRLLPREWPWLLYQFPSIWNSLLETQLDSSHVWQTNHFNHHLSISFRLYSYCLDLSYYVCLHFCVKWNHSLQSKLLRVMFSWHLSVMLKLVVPCFQSRAFLTSCFLNLLFSSLIISILSLFMSTKCFLSHSVYVCVTQLCHFCFLKLWRSHIWTQLFSLLCLYFFLMSQS